MWRLKVIVKTSLFFPLTYKRASISHRQLK